MQSQHACSEFKILRAYGMIEQHIVITLCHCCCKRHACNMAETREMVRMTTATTHSISVPSAIQRYYVYQRIWMAVVGEGATTVQELGNEHDR